MDQTKTRKLLAEYADNGSESAFRELVSSYVDLVYSTALRKVGGDEHLAQDVAQQVFTNLARKAPTLSREVMLGGWLHQHTCYTSATVVRTERRRKAREQKAVEMNTLHDDSDAAWKQIAPVLDDVINELDGSDRAAILLRFYERCDFRAVGAALGVSDDTAQKRVYRAVEKLRTLLAERGVALSATVLGTVLADRAVASAPAGFNASAAEIALAKLKSMGAGGWLQALRAPTKFALIGATIVALLISVAFVQFFKTHPASQATTPVSSPSSNRLSAAPEANANDEGNALASVATLAPAGIVSDAGQADRGSNALRLTIVTADSGQAVPNVPLEMRAWAGQKWFDKAFVSDRAGVCAVPFSVDYTEFTLTTRREGFADTRLEWRPDRGDEIPSHYTVKLTRATEIGGRVLGPDRKPVGEARIGIGHAVDPARQNRPQSHHFGWIETFTDADGRWKLNRIAPETVRRLTLDFKHPDYISQHFAVPDQVPAMEQLLAGTHVMELKKGASLHGIVLDADGQAVPDANVLVGILHMSDSRETKADAEGRFTVNGCYPGKNLLSADATGYAPTTMNVEIGDDAQPVTITLKRGKLLRVRVLNETGSPISGANLFLKTVKQGNSEFRTGNVQAEFSRSTDREGRARGFVADEELEYGIMAHGYEQVTRVMRPQSEEQIITMSREQELIVFGTVRDASNAKPISKFTMIAGSPDGDRVHWSTLDRMWVQFSGGKYRHTFDEPVIHGTEDPGYVLKFQADGYEPFVSQPLSRSRNEVRLDVLLNPSDTPMITVLLFNGQPAAHADVGLQSRELSFSLAPGRLSQTHNAVGGSVISTDAEGKLRLPSDPAIQHLIVAHPKGYNSASRTTLLSEPTIHLEEWGKVEGVCLKDKKPAAGRVVRFKVQAPNSASELSDDDIYKTTTDAAGRFQFPQVPHGRHAVVRTIYSATGSGVSSRDGEFEIVDIAPGKTISVTLELHAGSGTMVTARLHLPAGLESIKPYLIPPTPPMPAEGAGIPGAEAKFREFVRKNSPSYPMIRNTEGAWVADDVPPGTYEVYGIGYEPGTKQRTELTSSKVIVVPESLSKTIEAGDIALTSGK